MVIHFGRAQRYGFRQSHAPFRMITEENGMDSILQDAGFFVLRTPALPWDSIEDWARGVRAAAAQPAAKPGEATCHPECALHRVARLIRATRSMAEW
jgi:hypothetical protein